jgi:hypothetical protein
MIRNKNFQFIIFGSLSGFKNILTVWLHCLKEISFLKHKCVKVLTSIFIVHLYSSSTSYFSERCSVLMSPLSVCIWENLLHVRVAHSNRQYKESNCATFVSPLSAARTVWLCMLLIETLYLQSLFRHTAMQILHISHPIW